MVLMKIMNEHDNDKDQHSFSVDLYKYYKYVGETRLLGRSSSTRTILLNSKA